MSEAPNPPGRRLVTYPALRERFGITYSRQRLRIKARLGEFPTPVSVADNRIAWYEDEVQRWIETRSRVRYAPAAREAA